MAPLSLPRRMLHWIGDYWYIPALVIVAIVGYFTFRRWRGKSGEDILQPVLNELKVIQAGSQVREMQIQMGTDAAKAAVQEKYKAKTIALEAEQQAKVKELEDDPVALAKYLERITR